MYPIGGEEIGRKKFTLVSGSARDIVLSTSNTPRAKLVARGFVFFSPLSLCVSMCAPHRTAVTFTARVGYKRRCVGVGEVGKGRSGSHV